MATHALSTHPRFPIDNMFNPSFQEFKKLAKQGNVVPVYKEINADLDTPVSAFLKIREKGYAFLLESVEGQEKIGRYSFLGTSPSLVFTSKGRRISIRYPATGRVKEFDTATDPLDEVRTLMQGYKDVPVPGLPRFYGGMVGYLGYDMVRFFEDIPDKNPDELHLPDSVLMLTDTILIFDHVKHTIKIVSNCLLGGNGKKGRSEASLSAVYRQAVRRIETYEALLGKAVPAASRVHHTGRGARITSNFKKEEFHGIVDKSKKYIKAGDIIQVVLSQRFAARTDKAPFDMYRTLRSLNPSPYMFFLQMDGFHLVGSSPEILVRCEDRVGVVRPIAGTRPRGRDEQEDLELERELLADQKERAEHLMLVDLGRNDLGRVSKPGKVKVTEFMTVERYSHVMHLVSEVQGILENKYDIYDCLRASFPAGTVSGSPKIRAMEIIDELEKTRRGPYAGSVGYFSFSHNMDMCITIRTIMHKGNTAYVQAGAGIVADSLPAREYRETEQKAKALIEAISK